uniref:GH10215p n=1 Tax=Drosophila melanogaster TaxID=7227 RepID=Q95TE6_DROME|nr:GH10215p [Drosophila melanogaster]
MAPGWTVLILPWIRIPREWEWDWLSDWSPGRLCCRFPHPLVSCWSPPRACTPRWTGRPSPPRSEGTPPRDSGRSSLPHPRADFPSDPWGCVVHDTVPAGT